MTAQKRRSAPVEASSGPPSESQRGRDLRVIERRCVETQAAGAGLARKVEVASTLLTLGRTHGDLAVETLSPRPAEAAAVGPVALSEAGSRYDHVTLLGRGGMGQVDQVWDRDLMRNLALKRLHPERAEDGVALRQFLWEARVTAHLDHPNIVPVHDLGLDEDGELFFTMKFVHGISLEQLIATLRRVDEAEASGREPSAADAAIAEEHGSRRKRLRMFLELCNAIAYAHQRGILHRDLKPANVMIGEFGEVLIMDWGLALPLNTDAGAPLWALLPKALAPRGSSMTRPSGTPRYMSPEQVMGEELDARSDVYALGVMLYELMTLRSPYRAGELAALLLQVSEGETVPPREARPSISASLEAILDMAMARDRDERYAGVGDLVDDIEAVLDGLTPRAERASLATHFRRHHWSRGNPHASHLRLAHLDLSALAGLCLGLLIATLIGAELAALGSWATILLAVAVVIVGFSPTRAVVRAARAGVRRLRRIRARDARDRAKARGM